MESIKTIEVDRKYCQNSFGSTDLMVDYFFTIIDGHTKNTYLVTCKVQAIETGNIYLDVKSAKLVDHQEETNQFTLIEDAVISAFDELVS
jgi:hypothetical protein